MADTKDFLIGVVVGSAIGAAAALLYAPAAGTETRQMLREKSTEVTDRAADVAQQARDRATEVAQQARGRAMDTAQQARTKATEVVDQVKGRTEDIKGQVQEFVGRQTDAAKSAVEAGRQAYVEKQTELGQQVQNDMTPAGTGQKTAA